MATEAAGESLGTARIDVAVDMSELEVGVLRAQDHLQRMSQTGQAAYAGLNAAERRRIETLNRQVDTLGMTREQMLAYNITLRTSGELQADLLSRLDANISRQQVNAQVNSMMADSFANMQARARAAFKELQSAAREEQLLRDAHAAKALADATELAAIKAQHAAQGLEFLAMRADAERVNRMRQAVSVFGGSLDQLDTQENRATAAGRQFIAMVREQESAVRGASKAVQVFNQYGLTPKMEQAALRQVPAQLTDIFVSLQGGQNPLTVLLQQGGQLRDVFGGITPAIRAMGAQLLKLINPLTVTAAGIAAVVAAAYKGEKETNAFAQAIALAGDRAGASVGQLQLMSQQIADNATSQGKAAEALVLVARNGSFVSDQYLMVAEAAVNMERATGRAMDETIEKFASLAKEPASAVAKLNDEINFLTHTQYEQIRALEEQGRTQDAATLAMELYADSANERASEVEENLGTLQTAWRNVATAAKLAWDAMLDIGREDTLNERVGELSRQITALETDAWSYLQYGPLGSEARKEQIANRRAEMQRLVRADIDQNRQDALAAARAEANAYAIAQEESILRYRSADERRAAEIERSRKESNRKAAAALRAGDAELAQVIRDNQAAYEKALLAKDRREDRGYDRAVTKEGLQAFKDELAERQAALKADTAILRAEYDAKLVDQDEYFQRTRDLIVREQQINEDAIQGQITYLRSRNVTGKEAVDVQRELGKLEAQLAKVRSEAAGELKVLAIQEDAYLRQRKHAWDDYRDSLDLGTQSLRDQVQAQLDSILMGQRQFELQQRINKILRDAADAERDLQRARRDGAITPQEYQQRSQEVERAARERVEIERDAYRDIEIAQQDWRAGMRAGLQDWIDQASDVAGQVRRVTVSALDRIADGFAELALTGKLHWKQLLADILAEIVKFFAKQAVLQFVKYFAGAWLGNFTAPAAGSPAESAAYDSWYNANGGAGPAMAGGQMMPSGAMPTIPTAGGQQLSLNVTTNINAAGGGGAQQADPIALRQAGERIRNVVREEVGTMMRPGGLLWSAGVTQQ